MTLRDGTRLTAVELQQRFHAAATEFVDDRYGDDADAQTRDVLHRWGDVLDRLARDPMLCARELDWVAKLRLLEGFRDREGTALGPPPDRGDRPAVRRRASRAGALPPAARARVGGAAVDPELVRAAVTDPPEDTRAYFRGQCLARFGAEVTAASWDSLIFDVPGHPSLQRVPMLEPLRGTKEHVGPLLDRCETAADLVQALTRR